MIRSFKNKETQALYEGQRVPRCQAFQAQAERKLQMLDAVHALLDLRSPPGNQLEVLQGNRTGQHSIRINMQWRGCFVWHEDGPHDVEIVDYH